MGDCDYNCLTATNIACSLIITAANPCRTSSIAGHLVIKDSRSGGGTGGELYAVADPGECTSDWPAISGETRVITRGNGYERERERERERECVCEGCGGWG